VFAKDFDPSLHQKILPLSPEASLKTMVLQDGYSMEIVAAEPLIEEPVTMTFDGNGRIYVAEMLTYMQDAEGSDTFRSVSRIKRLEDKDGDGLFESYTVFADNLLLPRMITTLDDGRILVRETNTLDLLLLTDTDNDGVADLKETIYKGGNRGGNLEHQPSGLIYGLDNWMYVTYSDKRYKLVDGKVIAQSIPYGGGQWGLTQDHLGRFYYSTAGGQDPAFAFQAPSVYSQITVEGEQAPGYREVFPLSNTPDVQGGLKMLRPDNTLKRFTGGGGQSIYLGGIFDDMQGDYIIAEPVGNLIRRSKVTRENGYTVLSNRYQSQKKEFIASSDPNFRPVWTESAPDGSLMILDMYRGIIQEGNWTQKGSYLRGVIDNYGFDKVIGRGRLYRVKKEGVALDKLPKMFSLQPQQLVQYLNHNNRWWRLEAQKLMVLSGDKNLVPALKKVAQNGDAPLAQIHALWTLEGLGVLDKQILTELFNSEHSDVRVTAIRLSEQLAASGDKSILENWLSLASDKDIEVAQQVILSAFYVSSENHQQILTTAKRVHPNKKGIAAIEKSMVELMVHNEKRRILEEGNKQLAAAIIAGEKAYKSLCYTCHGSDGLGTPAGNALIAPSLHNNSRVTGNTASLINIVIHGMQGTIDGVTYTGGMMPSISSNGDEYVANVLTYLRNSFGNQGSMITSQDVAAVKKMQYAPKGMWTQAQLDSKFSQELTNKSEWKVSTNFNVHPNLNIEKLTDTLTKRPFFSSKTNREKGQTITIELPAIAYVSEVVIDSNTLRAFYSRHYTIEFSEDGISWAKVIDNKSAGEVNREQTLGHKAKFIRLTNQVGANRRPWRIQEISLFGSYL
jgi:mono/diheme cytochrome c family protein/glucose/arabinose dehydrogenase